MTEASARVVSGRIVIATHNAGKLLEFQELLRFYPDAIVSAGSLGLPSPEETGTTFKENALLKAEAAARATGNLALADDSGLCIHALNGRPGVYTADWVKDSPQGIDGAMQRVQDELGGDTDRSAHFICMLALCWPDGHHEFIEGRIDGTITKSPRGTQGHGYDPIFVPQGYDKTFAEMGETEKNKISHRGRATKQLVEKFFTTK